MKEFLTGPASIKIVVLLYIESAWITQADSSSAFNPQKLVHVGPLNELSGPTLKFRSVQQAVQDQESKTQQFARVKFDLLNPGQSNSSTKPGIVKDVCDRYDVDGCSIPFHLPFFFKQLFTPSCDRHDICYHCGVGRRITRLKCDETFRDNMRKTCTRIDYENKPWSSQSTYKSNAETKKHRITMQQIIENKTQFLTDLMENMTHEMKKDVGDTLRLLKSPDKLNFLRQNVLLEWALSLSEFVIRSSKRSTSTFKPKRWENGLIENKKNVVFKRHALLEDKNSAYYNTQPKYGINAAKRLIHGTDSETDSVGTSDHNLCAIVLKCADDISIHYQHYRTSDVLDCEDIHRLECLYTSNIYFIAVRLFGYSSYWKHAENYCNEGFVNGCLPQG